jgi:hypothetical protein
MYFERRDAEREVKIEESYPSGVRSAGCGLLQK